MNCIKCRKEIPDGSLYCNFCGKKQTVTKAKYHKRAHGTGTISKDTRYKNPYIAHAPATKHGSSRVYIGSFPTMREAQEAIDKYIKEGRPELYNSTLADIYEKWSAIHFKRVSDAAVSLYSSMWKRFSGVQEIKMRDIRTAHFQDIVNEATSKSACDTIKAMAVMLCKYAMENDIINKNYAEFVKIPKFDKKEKKIFSKQEIELLWERSDDKRAQAILFMIYTGFRIGEVVDLKVSDIHLGEGYIIGGEKTEAGKNRIVPLPPNIPELSDFLRKWIAESENEKVFPMSVHQFRRDYFYGCLVDIGLTAATKVKGGNYKFTQAHHTPHSTRHTFASISAAAGMRPENLQKIIGHSDFATTADIYVHQDIDTLRQEMAKIKR